LVLDFFNYLLSISWKSKIIFHIFLAWTGIWISGIHYVILDFLVNMVNINLKSLLNLVIMWFYKLVGLMMRVSLVVNIFTLYLLWVTHTSKYKSFNVLFSVVMRWLFLDILIVVMIIIITPIDINLLYFFLHQQHIIITHVIIFFWIMAIMDYLHWL